MQSRCRFSTDGSGALGARSRLFCAIGQTVDCQHQPSEVRSGVIQKLVHGREIACCCHNHQTPCSQRRAFAETPADSVEEIAGTSAHYDGCVCRRKRGCFFSRCRSFGRNPEDTRLRRLAASPPNAMFTSAETPADSVEEIAGTNAHLNGLSVPPQTGSRLLHAKQKALRPRNPGDAPIVKLPAAARPPPRSPVLG